ncbi:hypothetical protein M6B38_350895 [Iris pallida]|uniref:Probable purine permease n=1 Tax=Iris pallida TaxID=29817 RepID=A0AAX6GSK2_IRIPA|nr:hypothetical protein M6B38_350895 [Iris pallida]
MTGRSRAPSSSTGDGGSRWRPTSSSSSPARPSPPSSGGSTTRRRNSMWMATLVQSAGAPLLIPFLLLPPSQSDSSSSSAAAPPVPRAAVASTYVALGLLIAGDNLMYSYGLLYLPVSTYSLICSTQLAFSVAFAYLLNAQRLTALILNSVVLLVFAAALLGVSSGSDGSSRPEGEVPPGLRADARRVRHLLPDPLPDAEGVPEGGQEGDVRGGGGDADVDQRRGGVRLGGGAVRERGVAGAGGGDGGVREGEGGLRDDAAVDRGGVAGVVGGDGGADIPGVVALLQRDQHAGAAGGAGLRRGVLPRQDGRGEGGGDADRGVGVPLLHIPALHRRF